MIAGAIISGWVGLLIFLIQRRKDAVVGFRITLSELAAMTKTGDFHRRSCDSIGLSLSHTRPLIKPEVFSECEGILRDYKHIPEAEMDQQSEQALAYRLAHHIEVDERFLSYVRRFEKALGVHTMRNIHISGCKRLGIICSGFWMLVAVTIYFLGIHVYPSSFTNALSKLYTWVEGEPETVKGIDLTPLNPTMDGLKLSLFVLVPVMSGWLVLYVIPRSIRWVRDGFEYEHKHDP
jgi:hypothetical protein